MCILDCVHLVRTWERQRGLVYLKLLVCLKCLSLALQSSQHSAAVLLGSWTKWRISFVEQRTADKVVAAANRRRTQQVCVVSVLFWSGTRMLLVEHT